MNYMKINPCGIANGSGVHVDLYVSGCEHCCKGCFNPETWDFDAGENFTGETLDSLIEYMGKSWISGLTILGGEPMHPANISQVLGIVSTIRRKYPQKEIWIYSGYTLEELIWRWNRLGIDPRVNEFIADDTLEILNQIDILVDGRYREDLKDLNIKYAGSRNQRVIDMKKYKLTGKILDIRDN